MKRFVLATNNPKKRDELLGILAPLGWEIITLAEAGVFDVPEENGDSFVENAKIKAMAALSATGLPALADDSGLCVDALGGAPGIYSARYGDRPDDQSRTAYLLENMQGIADRRAHFACAIVAVLPGTAEVKSSANTSESLLSLIGTGDTTADNRTLIAEGRCDGEILTAPRGDGGFGYDPVFWVPKKRKSFSELSQDDKNAISHRGQAIRRMAALMREV